jgi:hypothetical protein
MAGGWALAKGPLFRPNGYLALAVGLLVFVISGLSDALGLQGLNLSYELALDLYVYKSLSFPNPLFQRPRKLGRGRDFWTWLILGVIAVVCAGAVFILQATGGIAT